LSSRRNKKRESSENSKVLEVPLQIAIIVADLAIKRPMRKNKKP
jgi:hypothetical protein